MKGLSSGSSGAAYKWQRIVICWLCICQEQIQDWEQIQKVWALQRMDAEKENPAALPWRGQMLESMHMGIYIEMAEVFISFLALLGNPCGLSVNCLHSRKMRLAGALS